MSVFVRQRGELPGGEAPVLLLPGEHPPGREAVRRAVAAAGGGTVAVVVVLRIHGSGWGLPHPGLLPTAGERDAADRLVRATVAALERAGGHADGQITASRHPLRVVVAAARRRSTTTVLVEQAARSRTRALLEGDLAAGLRRRLGPDVTVETFAERPRRPARSDR